MLGGAFAVESSPGAGTTPPSRPQRKGRAPKGPPRTAPHAETRTPTHRGCGTPQAPHGARRSPLELPATPSCPSSSFSNRYRPGVFFSGVVFFGVLLGVSSSQIGDLVGETTWGKNDGGPVRAAGRSSRPTLATRATSATAGSPPVRRPASAPARPSGWPRRRIATTTGERPRSPASRRGARRIPATVGARAGRRRTPRQRSPSRLSCPRQRLRRPCRALVTPRHRPRRGRCRHRYKISRGRPYKRSWLLNPMF